ncbi:hypothetical protein LOK74_09600 [Brevibacillus humidisoli]|uniref:hypothetical protein n=1 Tax=Brevibacillus humidisoli TaxID=2895522 RepID=UPI001E2CA6ED|nr:hypothetical protein [Brevibacillus humidisoli]UFJ42721.1 hypothetical protein LOK74_09600 [Brevibacillus humidisoli]
MRVIVISIRNVVIGAAVFLLVLIAGLVLLFSNSLDSSQSDLQGLGSEAVPASANNELYGSPKPELSLDVTLEGDEAYVKMLTENFRFVREDSTESADPVHGEGHAHLYLDGRFWQMLYEPEFKIKQLPKGEHEIRVELNYSNHLPYKVEAIKIINVE